jgi:hypothetical protein
VGIKRKKKNSRGVDKDKKFDQLSHENGQTPSPSSQLK